MLTVFFSEHRARRCYIGYIYVLVCIPKCIIGWFQTVTNADSKPQGETLLARFITNVNLWRWYRPPEIRQTNSAGHIQKSMSLLQIIYPLLIFLRRNVLLSFRNVWLKRVKIVWLTNEEKKERKRNFIITTSALPTLPTVNKPRMTNITVCH